MTSRRHICIVVLLAWVTGCVRVCAATPGEYRQVLMRTAGSLESAAGMEKAHQGSGKPALEQLRKSLPSEMEVSVGRGQRVHADFRWIATEIRNISYAKAKDRPSRLNELSSRVTMAARADAGSPAISTTSMQSARSTLRGILAKDEYKPSVRDDLSLRMVRAIGRFLQSIGEVIPEGTWGIIGYILAGLAVIAFAASLVYLVLMLINRYSGRVSRELPTHVKAVRVSQRPSVESLIEAADADAAGSRYREAFRSVYLATLFLLDREQLISYAEGSTNWEYIRTLRRQAQPEQTRVFGDMTLLFDQSFYGHRDVSRDDYLSSRRQFQELEAML